MNGTGEIVSAPPNAQDLIEAETTLTAIEAESTILKIIETVENKRARLRFRRRLNDYVREHGLTDMPPLKRLKRLVAALTEPDAERWKKVSE